MGPWMINIIAHGPRAESVRRRRRPSVRRRPSLSVVVRRRPSSSVVRRRPSVNLFL